MKQRTRHIRTTIRSKLTLQMLLVGLVPLLVLGGVAYITHVAFGRPLQPRPRAVGGDHGEAGRGRRAHEGGRRPRHSDRQLSGGAREGRPDLGVRSARRRGRHQGRRHRPPSRVARLPGHRRGREGDRAYRGRDEGEPGPRSVPAATQYLKDQLAQSQAYREVFFTDKNGYNVAVSNPTSDFVQSDEEWWVNAWKHQIDIGGTSQNPRP